MSKSPPKTSFVRHQVLPKMNLAEHNAWVWNSRWTHLHLRAVTARAGTASDIMEPTFFEAINEDEILRSVKALKRANINAVLTEGVRHLIRYEHDGKTDKVIGAIRRATEACHRAGIKVIHHTTTAFAGHHLSEFPDACQEWLNIDAQTGSHANINWEGGWYLWCINNPDFRAEYFRLCQKVLRETGVDGLMADEVYFRANGWHTCACAYCRKKFRMKTGFVLPSIETPSFWGHFDNVVFRAWIRFRAASVGDFYADLSAAIRKAHSYPVLLGCANHEEDPAQTAMFGDSNEERMRGGNLLFFEAYEGPTASILYSWRRMSVSFMAYDGLSNYYGTPTMALMVFPNFHDSFISWAMRVAHGIRVWATGPRCLACDLPPRERALYGELFGWEKKHENEFAGAIRPLANIGVLFSASTRNMMLSHQGSLGAAPVSNGDWADFWFSYVREWVGWCETLSDEYMQYAVPVAQEFTLSCLRQYALIILADTTCMSDAACQAVVEYVAQGGNLIFTHKTGICDETGSQNAMDRLEKLGIRTGSAGRNASSSEQGTVTFGRYGLGKWVYFSNCPGQIVYLEGNKLGQPRIENVPSAPVVFDEDRALQKSLMINAVRWATGGKQPLTVKQASEGLLIKAFHQQNTKHHAVVVHLLNCRGDESVKFGEIIPDEYTVEFPSLEKDIILELCLDSIKQAYLISPDWPGRKPVQFDRIDDVFQVTIPALTLKRYEVLYVETSSGI